MPLHKFGRPKKRSINEKEVGEFLKSIGFTTDKIEQPWRHLIAFGRVDGKDAIFKLSSTQEVSPRTQNEYYWNDAVHLAPSIYRQYFIVPYNYSFGEYKKLFYFIAQRFTGEPFVRNGILNQEKLSSKIKKIALVTREIQKLPIPKATLFYKIQDAKKQTPIGDHLFASAKEWAERSEMNLEGFLKIIEKDRHNIRASVAHGDFVPRQLYDENNKIGIIDGEHAGIRGPLYYDVAWFYIRLRTEYDAVHLANQYLSEFKRLLPKEEKEVFWEELKPVFAQRYIGSIWNRGKNIDLEKEKIFQEQILNDNLLKD